MPSRMQIRRGGLKARFLCFANLGSRPADSGWEEGQRGPSSLSAGIPFLDFLSSLNPQETEASPPHKGPHALAMQLWHRKSHHFFCNFLWARHYVDLT